MTELAEEARTRQGLYRFTGAALRPPAADMFAILGPAVEFMHTRDLERFSFVREWHALAAVVTDPPPVEALEPEYVRLFGVGMSGTPATPTESFYRVPKREGGVGDFIAQLQNEYRRMGLSWAGASEPPDHVATEMDAMSFLAGLEADAWQTGRDDEATSALRNQLSFLNRHLSVWVLLFVTKAKAANPAPFYSAAVEFLHSLVIHEKSMASILLTELEST